MLSKLPEYLIGAVLMSWLELVDIYNLDVAICDQIDRVEFWAILASKWFKFKTKLLVGISNITWIAVRRLKLESVQVHVEIEDIVEVVSQWKGLTAFSAIPNPALTAEREYTPNFDDYWKEVIVRNNVQLTKLEVWDVVNLKSLCDCIATNAPNMEVLTVAMTIYRGWEFYLHHCDQLFVCCLNIQKVDLFEATYNTIDDEWEGAWEVIVEFNNERECYLTQINPFYEYTESYPTRDFEKDLKIIENFKLVGFIMDCLYSNCDEYDNELWDVPHPIWIEIIKNQHSLREVIIPHATWDETQRLLSNNRNLLLLELVINNLDDPMSCDFVSLLAQNSINQNIVSLSLQFFNKLDKKYIPMSFEKANDILMSCPRMIDYYFWFAPSSLLQFMSQSIRRSVHYETKSGAFWLWERLPCQFKR